jgi:DNA sulfur modification protein DndE
MEKQYCMTDTFSTTREKKKLKFSAVTTSSRVQKNLGIMRIKTGLTPNISLRFGFCMSLKDPSIPNPDEYNQEGSKLEPAVLFGTHEPIYMALMLNRLKKDGLDPELYLQKMTRAHMNRGATALWPRINDLSDFYELVKDEQNE